jgi:cytochrome b561
MKYHIIQRIIHWVMALLIISLLFIGFIMHDLQNETRYLVYNLHKSLGILVLIFLVFRIVARIKLKVPAMSKKFKKWEVNISKFMHYFFYILMLLMPLSGWIMSNAKGYGVKLFGMKMPFIVAKNKIIGDVAHEMHEVIAWILVFMIVIHVLAVIKHYVIDKENILTRMS